LKGCHGFLVNLVAAGQRGGGLAAGFGERSMASRWLKNATASHVGKDGDGAGEVAGSVEGLAFLLASLHLVDDLAGLHREAKGFAWIGREQMALGFLVPLPASGFECGVYLFVVCQLLIWKRNGISRDNTAFEDRADFWSNGDFHGRLVPSYYQLSNFPQRKTFFILLRKSFVHFVGMRKDVGHESKQQPSTRAL
jgi:hypothetical protein